MGRVIFYTFEIDVPLVSHTARKKTIRSPCIISKDNYMNIKWSFSYFRNQVVTYFHENNILNIIKYFELLLIKMILLKTGKQVLQFFFIIFRQLFSII